jgi:hypothetical protein
VDRCGLRRSATTPTNKLFADWKIWCALNGEQPGAQSTFSEALAGKGLSKWRTPEGGPRGYRGISLANHPGDDFMTEGEA